MSRWSRSPAEQAGAAVVDFVLVAVVLVPLFLGVLQVGLVAYVRTTVAAAASEAARYAARVDRAPADGVAVVHRRLDGVLSPRFTGAVTAREVLRDGIRLVEVRVVVEVPALGLGGPSVAMVVTGHAVREVVP